MNLSLKFERGLVSMPNSVCVREIGTRCLGEGDMLNSPVTTTSLWISSFKHFLFPGDKKNLTPEASCKRVKPSNNFIFLIVLKLEFY